MKPTFHLRYIEVEPDASKPLCISRKYGEEQYYQLQQWWEDDSGKGEWRFVAIDFSMTKQKPMIKNEELT